jgi:hypothetical protein
MVQKSQELLNSMTTHIAVTHRAAHWFSDLENQDYVQIMKHYQAFLQAGSFFPDCKFNS